jgi:hypothetical protein
MTRDDDIREALKGNVPDAEVESLVRLAQRLRDERPLPAPAFRGELGRRLAAPGTSRGRDALPAPRRAIAIWSVCGTLLILLPLAGVLGAGPFAADRNGDGTTALVAR